MLAAGLKRNLERGLHSCYHSDGVGYRKAVNGGGDRSQDLGQKEKSLLVVRNKGKPRDSSEGNRQDIRVKRERLDADAGLWPFSSLL